MSAKSVCDMSCGQMHEFALVLDKAGFNAEIIQSVVVSRKNKLAQAMLAAIPQTDTHFKLVKTLDIVVPDDYVHETRLASFAGEHRREFYYYDENLTDEHFSRATVQLEPGQRLKVDIFQIRETVASEDCLAFLRSQKAILTGAQGASLVYEQKRDELPKGRWHASFDEKEALWQDPAGYHRVPYIFARSVGGFRFDLGHFGNPWYDDFCLLSVCDAE